MCSFLKVDSYIIQPEERWCWKGIECFELHESILVGCEQHQLITQNVIEIHDKVIREKKLEFAPMKLE